VTARASSKENLKHRRNSSKVKEVKLDQTAFKKGTDANMSLKRIERARIEEASLK
jgi:hypothetical protein